MFLMLLVFVRPDPARWLQAGWGEVVPCCAGGCSLASTASRWMHYFVMVIFLAFVRLIRYPSVPSLTDRAAVGGEEGGYERNTIRRITAPTECVVQVSMLILLISAPPFSCFFTESRILAPILAVLVIVGSECLVTAKIANMG